MILLKENQVSLNNFCDIKKLIFPPNYELLPNLTEIFELEFAFYEYRNLTKEEIIKRSAFFKSIDCILTNHYLIGSYNTNDMLKGKSDRIKSYFREGRWSTGYATHGLFPYRGKFHPQLIKGILNLLKIQPGEKVLDPMCGSGTLNIEASLIGIDSIGFDISPFCILMSKTKYQALKTNKDLLIQMENKAKNDYLILSSSTYLPEEFKDYSYSQEKSITLLAYLDAMGYSRRTKKATDALFPYVLNRYLEQIKSFVTIKEKISLEIGKAEFFDGDARQLELLDCSVDAVITSPPYSFAIDYAENDKPQLEYLGYDVSELKKQMVGLNGRTKKEKLAKYFEDMEKIILEIYRVLKPNKYAVIIIGSNDIQTGGIRLETTIEKIALRAGFQLDKKIVKPIKGIQNTMKDEYILFFRKK